MSDGRYRVAFVGGPWDGRVELMTVPLDGTYRVPNVDAALNGGTPTTPYIFRRLRDLDGTTVYIAAPEGAPDPAVTLSGLLAERQRLITEHRQALRRADDAESMATRALRRTDELAGELRDLRESITIERNTP